MTKRSKNVVSLNQHRRTKSRKVDKSRRWIWNLKRSPRRLINRFLFGKFVGGIAALALVGHVIVMPMVDAINGILKPVGNCKILRLIDGDTISMFCPVEGKISYRLIGFDTPEKRGACASERLKARGATYYLRWLLLKAKSIESVAIGLDRYDRKLVTLFVDDLDISNLMISAGWARPYDSGVRGAWCKNA